MVRGGDEARLRCKEAEEELAVVPPTTCDVVCLDGHEIARTLEHISTYTTATNNDASIGRKTTNPWP